MRDNNTIEAYSRTTALPLGTEVQHFEGEVRGSDAGVATPEEHMASLDEGA
jgi:hypothetical protein